MNPRDERREKFDGLENLATVNRMLLEILVFGRCQLSGLVEVHHAADLTDIVHEGSLPDDLDLVLGKPQLDGEDLRISRDSLRMSRRIAVEFIDGARKAADGLLKCRLKVSVEVGVLDRRRCTARHKVEELPLSFIEAARLRERGEREEADHVALHAEGRDHQRANRIASLDALNKVIGLLPVNEKRAILLEISLDRIEIEALDALWIVDIFAN